MSVALFVQLAPSRMQRYALYAMLLCASMSLGLALDMRGIALGAVLLACLGLLVLGIWRMRAGRPRPCAWALRIDDQARLFLGRPGLALDPVALVSMRLYPASCLWLRVRLENGQCLSLFVLPDVLDAPARQRLCVSLRWCMHFPRGRRQKKTGTSTP